MGTSQVEDGGSEEKPECIPVDTNPWATDGVPQELASWFNSMEPRGIRSIKRGGSTFKQPFNKKIAAKTVMSQILQIKSINNWKDASQKTKKLTGFPTSCQSCHFTTRIYLKFGSSTAKNDCNSVINT